MKEQKDKKYKLQGCLTNAEWNELVALEYVLTWRYSEHGEEEKDEKRYKKLSKKRWESLQGKI